MIPVAFRACSNIGFISASSLDASTRSVPARGAPSSFFPGGAGPSDAEHAASGYEHRGGQQRRECARHPAPQPSQPARHPRPPPSRAPADRLRSKWLLACWSSAVSDSTVAAMDSVACTLYVSIASSVR